MSSRADRINSLSRNLILSNIKSITWKDLMKKCSISYGSDNLKLFKEKLKKENICFYPFDKHELINKQIFKEIDTKEKAYWLGFLSADGYIPKDRNLVRISLSVKDEEIIDKFISFLGSSQDHKRYSIGKYNNKMVHFSLSNKDIADSIKKLGIVSPKGKNLKIIDFVDEEINLSYLMGFYDGDGFAHSPTIACGSKKFLQSVKNKYKIKNKLSLKKNHFGSVYELNLGIEFYKILIENYKDSLPRKREVATYKNYKDKCPMCNEDKHRSSKVCSKCNKEKDRSKVKLNLKQIENYLLSGRSLSSIANEVGLSDNGLKKRLIKENLYDLNQFSFENRKTKKT